MRYKICPECGAHLDHGERCDCCNAHDQPEIESARVHKPHRPTIDQETYFDREAALRYRRWLMS